MLKVTLLKDHAAQSRKAIVKPTVSRTGLLLLAIFVLAAGGMGAWAFSVGHQIQAGTRKRDALRIEEARLQNLKKEIEKYETLKQQRQTRIDIIEKLKENQKGPVLLLNSVIHSIPQNGAFWLTSVVQKAALIKIVGFTQREETIPDFMTHLAASGIFETVDLELVERQKEATKFSLICTSKTKPQAE